MFSLRCLSRATARTSAPSFLYRTLVTAPIIPPKPKAKTILPVSAAPAGTQLKGINYIKGKDDPVALAEEEYPEWLWRCLESKDMGADGDVIEGDEFCMSYHFSPPV